MMFLPINNVIIRKMALYGKTKLRTIEAAIATNRKGNKHALPVIRNGDQEGFFVPVFIYPSVSTLNPDFSSIVYRSGQTVIFCTQRLTRTSSNSVRSAGWLRMKS